MTTSSTDTRQAQLVECPGCDFAVVLEPRSNFPRTWWMVGSTGTAQAPSLKAAKERLQRHRRDCGPALHTSTIDDFVMPDSGAQHDAVFASLHAR